ncbi:MAG TPA: inorganic phosphate transporter [Kofleriaceae bacterium]|nr:inorganic phosphate transporter [Kofleriaceae bacterium]
MSVAGLVYLTIAVALVFDVINGFHDAANSIATVVSTRVLSPRWAVLWAAAFNFIAFFIFGTGVAKTIAGIVHVAPQEGAFVYVVACGLLGAIVWNLFTWWLGLPSSSSHALIGGLSGAGVAYHGFGVLDTGNLYPTLEFIILAPLIGLVLGGALMTAVAWTFQRFRPRTVDRTFRVGQLASAAAYSLGHGGNDAQKTVGVILAVLIANGTLRTDAHGGLIDPVPAWILPASYACMALGTAVGGWRIVKTMGMGLTPLRPVGGFCAEVAGAITLFSATHFRVPVSTTHTITGAIVGVGSVTKLRGIRWSVATRIVWGWIFTIPAAAAVGAGAFALVRAIGY